MHDLLLARTQELISGCECHSGCPSCVGPEGNTGPHAKQVASRILAMLIEQEQIPAGVIVDASEQQRREHDRMDLTSKLRSIVRSGPPKDVRELTYEPDDGYRNAAAFDLDSVAGALGGRRVSTRFGECLVIDRRYESDRWHGGIRIGDCTLDDFPSLRILDPGLGGAPTDRGAVVSGPAKTVFIDLETTGLSGGAGTLAFLVGCAYFDLGAFQVRQFLLTSHAGERALLAAVAEFFDDADLIVTYNGKTFDVPVMETRWSFHRMEMPLDGVPHFDMLHPARRLWKKRTDDRGTAAGCRPWSGIFSTCSGSETCRGWRCPRDFSGSSDPAIRGRSKLSSSTTGSISYRSPRSRHARYSWRATGVTPAPIARKRSRSDGSSSGRSISGARKRVTGTRRRHRDAATRAEALFHLAVRLRRDRRFVDAAESGAS